MRRLFVTQIVIMENWFAAFFHRGFLLEGWFLRYTNYFRIVDHVVARLNPFTAHDFSPQLGLRTGTLTIECSAGYK